MPTHAIVNPVDGSNIRNESSPLSPSTSLPLQTKLPNVGTTIFTVMSQLAAEHSAVNLGQGFPDFEPAPFLQDELARAMRESRNQYAPMTGIAPLREQIAAKISALYGRQVNADTDVTVTSRSTSGRQP